jgi:hypothetical protein
MVKRFILIFIVCVMLLPTFVVYADLITEPDNDFFDRNKNECVYLGRSFIANGADGFVQVKTEPESNRRDPEIENGEVIFMDYSCLYKGKFWGFTEQHSGWVQIDGQLLVMYDYVAFEEDNLKDFYTYKGDYAEIKETRAAVAWPWPGADSPLWTIEDLDTINFRVLHAYKDKQNREWGFVTYLYGSPNIWFCLSDPLNKNIPAFNPAPQPSIWVSETAHNDVGKTGTSALTLVIVLVVTLVIGSKILIKVFWKPNKQEERND